MLGLIIVGLLVGENLELPNYFETKKLQKKKNRNPVLRKYIRFSELLWKLQDIVQQFKSELENSPGNRSRVATSVYCLYSKYVCIIKKIPFLRFPDF